MYYYINLLKEDGTKMVIKNKKEIKNKKNTIKKSNKVNGTSKKENLENHSKKVSLESLPGHPHKETVKYIIYAVLGIIGVILLLALISNYRGSNESDNENYYSYHGFDFVKHGDMVQTQIQIKADMSKLYTIELRYGPRELKDIPVIGEPKYFSLAEEVYVAFNPDDENLQYVALATADIQMNLIRVLNKKMIAACTEESEECEGTPIKNCENSELPIIIVRQDPVALVEQKGNCLFVQGPDMDMVRAADKFLLYLYGIMDK